MRWHQYEEHTFNFVHHIILPVPISLATDPIAESDRRALIKSIFALTEGKPLRAEHLRTRQSPTSEAPLQLTSSFGFSQGFLESSQLTKKLSRIVAREAPTNSEPPVKLNLRTWLPGSCQGLAPSSKCMGHRSSGRVGGHDKLVSWMKKVNTYKDMRNNYALTHL